MSTSAELITAVRAAAKDTPYAVRETTKGFDLTIDVVDAKWLAILKAHGLKQVFTHEVKLDEAKQQMVIVDVSNTLNWGAGGASPRLHAQKSFQRGRVHQKSFRKEWGVDLKSGEVGTVVDYTFDASAGRDIIRDVAKAQGWSEKMGGEQKGALIVAGLTLAALVIGFGAVGLAKLLG